MKQHVTLPFKSPAQLSAIEDLLEERERQDATFGIQNHHPTYWLAILGKQQGQLGSAIVNREWAAEDQKERLLEQIRWEATQVAAVAVAMVEAINRGDVPSTLVTSQPSDPRQRARALNRGDESMPYEEPQWTPPTDPGSDPVMKDNY